MANGKKPKKGIQVGPDVKKAYNKAVNIATDALVGPANIIAKNIGYGKVAKAAAETIAGPVYQGAKALYSHLNPSQAKEASVKKPSPPKKEKIYDLGVLPEHEVVASKGDDKGFKQSIKGVKRPSKGFKETIKSQGAENLKKAPIRPAKNPLQNRPDLERSSAMMMKVKNPLQSPIHNGEGGELKKAPIIPPQNPGVYKGVNLNKPLPIKADFYGSGGPEYDHPELKKGIVGKETKPSAHTAVDQSELFWRKTAHNVASDRPVDSKGKSTKGKGISSGALADLMHLERHGQTSRLTSGPLSTPTEKIKKGFKKGWDDYLAKP